MVRDRADNGRPLHASSTPVWRRRTRRVAEYRVVGTAPEAQFDNIASLARTIFSTPIGLVTFVDTTQIWLKARLGLDVSEAPREIGFCAHAVMSDDVMVVPDLLEDVRFATNPLVQGNPRIRFYAGAPLVVSGHHRIGTLCIMDVVPRPALSIAEMRHLSAMASLVVDRLELRRLQFANAIARGFSDSTSEAMLCIDGEGVLTFANQAALRLFGYAAREIIGSRLDLIMPERFRDAHTAGVMRIAQGGRPKLAGKTVEIVALRRDGQEFPAELAMCSWRDENGLSIGATVRDITERKERDARLHRLAHLDPLTGLANRTRVDKALQEAYAVGGPVALLLLDLDGFKLVNDSLGHAAGDALLQSLALRLHAALDADAVLARFGGDEFAVILTRHGDPTLLAGCADSILSAIEAPFHLLGHDLQISVSIGGAVGPNHGRDAEELVASADLALYRAKADGRNRFRLFEPTMRSALSAKRALQDGIKRAVDHGELILHFQPQVDLGTKRVFGAEALLRWQHPERGLLLPGAFLSALETHTLAQEVGAWVLNEACRQASLWRETGLPRLRMSVNLFAAQIRDRRFVLNVVDALERYGLAAADLELEIVETIALQDDERVLAPLRDLHGMGVGLAFDDFGTGYASLSSLKRVPLTTLKIDRSFVRDLMEDVEDAAVVEAVVGMGRRLGVAVIAEGIENADQEARLLALGCAAGQGFRYGRPTPAASFAQHLAQSQLSPSHCAGGVPAPTAGAVASCLDVALVPKPVAVSSV